MSGVFITQLDITNEIIKQVETEYISVIKKNAKVICYHYKPLPKENFFVERVFPLLMTIFLTGFILWDVFLSSSTCPTSYSYNLILAVMLALFLYFLYRGNKVSLDIFNGINHISAKRYARHTLKNVKAQSLPFTAIYQWNDGNIKYTRKFNDREKQQFNRGIADESFDFYDFQKNYLLMYQGEKYGCPIMFMFFNEINKNQIENTLVNFGLKSINSIVKND